MRVTDDVSEQPAELQLTEGRVFRFVDAEVLPVINGYWEQAKFPWTLIEQMVPLGIVAGGIEGRGCPPMDPLSAGLPPVPCCTPRQAKRGRQPGPAIMKSSSAAAIVGTRHRA